MGTRAAALAAVALVACGDPTVELSFDIPEAYEDRIASVSLRVLVPPASVELDCDRLAFGEIPDDTLSAATVEEVQTQDQRTLLARVPRQGPKLFWFTGRDDDSLPVVAACGELGTVHGDASLELLGEPATVVAADPLNELGGVPLPSMVTVFVTDIENEPLENTDVRYQIVGAAGETSEGLGTTSGAGTLVITPEPPSLPGPAALSVRTRWARNPDDKRFIAYQPAPLLAQESLGNVEDRALPGDGSFTYAVGRIGPAGEPGFAAVALPESGGGLLDRRVILYHWNGTQLVRNQSDIIEGLAAISQVTRGGREHVIAINGDGWLEISATGAISTHSDPIGLGLAERVTRFFPVGPCEEGSTGSEQLLVLTNTGTAEVVTAERQLVADSEPIAGLTELGLVDNVVLGAGCVAGTDETAHRTVLARDPEAEVIRFIAFMDQVRQGIAPIAAGGIGFARQVGTESARLLGTGLSLSGATLTRYRLLPLGEGEVGVEEVDDDPTPTVPASTAGGDVDGDGNTDVVAVVTTGGGRGEVPYRLLVSLGVALDDGNLVGLSGESRTTGPRVWLYDFDADGDDDILVGGLTSFEVLQMGP